MADRDMSSGLVTETEKNTVTYYEILEIAVGAGYYISNAPFDISYDGNTYISMGGLISADSIEENIGFEIERLAVTIGGIDPLPGDTEPFIEKILTLDYVDRPLIITRVYYSQGSQVGGVQLYNGYINSAGVERALGEQGVVVRIESSNNWTDFARVNGRQTNDNSQQAVFSGDLGMEYCKEMQKQVEWKPVST
jgi:hypothetical protein